MYSPKLFAQVCTQSLHSPRLDRSTQSCARVRHPTRPPSPARVAVQHRATHADIIAVSVARHRPELSSGLLRWRLADTRAGTARPHATPARASADALPCSHVMPRRHPAAATRFAHHPPTTRVAAYPYAPRLLLPPRSARLLPNMAVSSSAGARASPRGPRARSRRTGPARAPRRRAAHVTRRCEQTV